RVPGGFADQAVRGDDVVGEVVVGRSVNEDLAVRHQSVESHTLGQYIDRCKSLSAAPLEQLDQLSAQLGVGSAVEQLAELPSRTGAEQRAGVAKLGYRVVAVEGAARCRPVQVHVGLLFARTGDSIAGHGVLTKSSQ